MEDKKKQEPCEGSAHPIVSTIATSKPQILKHFKYTQS